MWYVILDKGGCASQHFFESKTDLLDWLEKGLSLRRVQNNKWANGGRWKIVLVTFKEWSDATKMVSQINEMANDLRPRTTTP